MQAKCGLSDCDCDHTISRLLAALEKIEARALDEDGSRGLLTMIATLARDAIEEE